MSYRHFKDAPHLYCKGAGDHICVKELDGRINTYSCPLGFSTDWQLNVFEGPNGMWCLINDGVLFVGRDDGTFSGFRESDGLLVRYGVWSYPGTRLFEKVGVCGGYYVELDRDDGRTIYIHDTTRAYMLHKPLVDNCMDWDMLARYEDCLDLVISMRGGGLLDTTKAGVWIDTPESGWNGVPIRL